MAVEDQGICEGPARGGLFGDARQGGLCHARIMLYQHVIERPPEIAHEARETHDSARAVLAGRELAEKRTGIKRPGLKADIQAQPPVMGGKNAISRASPSGVSKSTSS